MQGENDRKSAEYNDVFEHFEKVFNAAVAT